MDKLAKGTGEALAAAADEELLRTLNEANALLEQVRNIDSLCPFVGDVGSVWGTSVPAARTRD